MTFGIPVPSSNINATNFLEHSASYPYSDLIHLATNSTFYYSLKVVQIGCKSR